MTAVDLQVVIARPAGLVFDALADLRYRPRLDPSIVETAAPEGVAEVGCSFAGRGLLSGREERFEGMVTALETDELIAFGYAYANGARLLEQWRLRPTPSGTLINYHAELTLPGGPFGRLLGAFVGGGFTKQREAVLREVKATLEALEPE